MFVKKKQNTLNVCQRGVLEKMIDLVIHILAFHTATFDTSTTIFNLLRAQDTVILFKKQHFLLFAVTALIFVKRLL